jgi:hypothetical protein
MGSKYSKEFREEALRPCERERVVGGQPEAGREWESALCLTASGTAGARGGAQAEAFKEEQGGIRVLHSLGADL